MIDIVRSSLNNPWLIPLRIAHWYHRELCNDNSISVMKREWDNLIVLDACRYDVFASCWVGPGELSSAISKGSNTPEWLNRTFTDLYPDTVYVTGNPQVQANDIASKFYQHVSVWRHQWDDELQTVLPTDMADETIKAVETYDNKRVISHWIQPHYPFIGETGLAIRQGSLTGDGVFRETTEEPTIWDKLEREEIDKETVWKAYIENLKVVLPEVYRTIEAIEGRTVVTSDHGNVFGRYGLFGHPGHKYIQELVKVPWLIVDGKRRSIRAECVGGESEVDELVEERLSSLGYT